MARRPPSVRSWPGLAFAGLLFAAACTAAATPLPTESPSPTATVTAGPTPTGSAIPSVSIPPGCAQEADGLATQPRVSIKDIGAQTYPEYDVLIFDFDRGLPDYTIAHVEPPFSGDPSGQPIDVEGSYFFSVVLHGASIVDDEIQPVYEGPTNFEPNLTRIEHVVLAGDFEAVSSWIVGLSGPACLAAQAFPGNRLVIAFIDATSVRYSP